MCQAVFASIDGQWTMLYAVMEADPTVWGHNNRLLHIVHQCSPPQKIVESMTSHPKQWAKRRASPTTWF